PAATPPPPNPMPVNPTQPTTATNTRPVPPRTPPSSLPGRRQASPEEQNAERDEAANTSAPKGGQVPVASLEKKAAAGDIRTMVQTGDSFATGRGGAQDYARAKQWYEKAAGKGDAGAMLRIGDLYLKGNGVPRDYVMARSW